MLQPWINFKNISLLSAILGVTLLSGCSTQVSKTAMPPSSMTMSQIYNKETSPSSGQGGQQTYAPDKLPEINGYVNYKDYTRTAQNETHSQFKLYPNPSVPIYIFPHLASFNGTSAPIPAYSSSFYVYKENHYAMPAEVY